MGQQDLNMEEATSEKGLSHNYSIIFIFQDDPNICCHSLVTSSARVKLEVRACSVRVDIGD